MDIRWGVLAVAVLCILMGRWAVGDDVGYSMWCVGCGCGVLALTALLQCCGVMCWLWLQCCIAFCSGCIAVVCLPWRGAPAVMMHT